MPPLRPIAAALALLSLCAAPATGGPPAVRVDVHPALVELEPGERQRFQARVRDPGGAVLDLPVRWHSDGGRIGPSGVFRAERPGRYTVTATTLDGRLAGTATAVVRDAPKALGRLLLQPREVTLAPGAAVQFRARLLGRAGQPLPAELAWTARGGHVDQQGRFVAGAHAGRFRVTVRERRTGAVASAVVEVRPGPKTPRMPEKR